MSIKTLKWTAILCFVVAMALGQTAITIAGRMAVRVTAR